MSRMRGSGGDRAVASSRKIGKVTAKSKTQAEAGVLPVSQVKGDSKRRDTVRKISRPTVLSAITIDAFRPLGLEALSLPALVEELGVQVARTVSGDLDRPVAMLTAQAHTLDAIFNRLAMRAASNMAEHPPATETYLKLALRAQSQCRATLETLAAIKNPPVVFAKQANISHGHQQVNNGIPRAEQTERVQNKLLEEQDGQWMDARASGTSSGVDSAVAPLGEVYGPKE